MTVYYCKGYRDNITFTFLLNLTQVHWIHCQDPKGDPTLKTDESGKYTATISL